MIKEYPSTQTIFRTRLISIESQPKKVVVVVVVVALVIFVVVVVVFIIISHKFLGSMLPKYMALFVSFVRSFVKKKFRPLLSKVGG